MKAQFVREKVDVCRMDVREKDKEWDTLLGYRYGLMRMMRAPICSRIPSNRNSISLPILIVLSCSWNVMRKRKNPGANNILDRIRVEISNEKILDRNTEIVVENGSCLQIFLPLTSLRLFPSNSFYELCCLHAKIFIKGKERNTGCIAMWVCYW